MNTTADPDNLLDRIEAGDREAIDLLLGQYRQRLRDLVALRLDPRLAGRIDASDVVQETLVKASQRISAYVASRKLPFYPWLRGLAIDRLVEIHRRHIRAQNRSITREVVVDAPLSSCGRQALARNFVSVAESPSEQTRLHEEIQQAQAAIERLPAIDREVLVLRYLEQLTPREAAGVLGIAENTFAQRHLRALRRVRAILSRERGTS